MAKAKITLYPYVVLDSSAQFSHMAAYIWETKDKMSEEGTFSIALPKVEIEVTVPDDYRPACLALLRQHRGQLSAEHQATLTRLQFVENSLLGLAAPDVLDAA